jgi:hypothetical protein
MRFAFGRGKNERERQFVVKGARFGKRPLQKQVEYREQIYKDFTTD